MAVSNRTAFRERSELGRMAMCVFRQWVLKMVLISPEAGLSVIRQEGLTSG